MSKNTLNSYRIDLKLLAIELAKSNLIITQTRKSDLLGFISKRVQSGVVFFEDDSFDSSAEKSISKGAKVICIDEFFVEDIADAMILSELLTGLIDENVTLVITSNSHPQELYKKGLQRERFMKAIDLLVDNTAILNIGNGPDYRLKDSLMDIKFNSIHNEESDHLLKKFFHTKTPIGVSDNGFNQTGKGNVWC